MIIFICSLISFMLFLFLIQRGTLQQQEESLALFVIKSRTPSLTRMMLFFTNFGKALPTIIILLLLYALPATRESLAIKAASSVILVSALTYVIKRIVRRERPRDHRLVEEKDHSFPSAHAATSAALYGVLAMNMAHLLPLAVLPMSILAVLVSFMIGFSRVYLGIHFLTDVIGGWFLGSAVAALVTVLL
ncbi:phosphatase PAP2 family protein [Enterococcus sp.]|uniref:phosphatase PAP2 family protein n=1 Tax=Enterococcus sp. TaxID=35783 RepID=UPI0025C6DD52|nr:phosphatase PAP2 family protein [Enterococcus sp.]